MGTMTPQALTGAIKSTLAENVTPGDELRLFTLAKILMEKLDGAIKAPRTAASKIENYLKQRREINGCFYGMKDEVLPNGVIGTVVYCEAAAPPQAPAQTAARHALSVPALPTAYPVAKAAGAGGGWEMRAMTLSEAFICVWDQLIKLIERQNETGDLQVRMMEGFQDKLNPIIDKVGRTEYETTLAHNRWRSVIKREIHLRNLVYRGQSDPESEPYQLALRRLRADKNTLIRDFQKLGIEPPEPPTDEHPVGEGIEAPPYEATTAYVEEQQKKSSFLQVLGCPPKN